MHIVTPEPENDNAPSTIELIENNPMEKGRSKFWKWWYRIAAPPVPATTASLKEREAYRRGKLISTILLILMVVLTIVMLTAGVFVNHTLIPSIGTTLVVLSGAIMLNRRGYVLVAGILAVVMLDVGVALNFLTYPSLSVFLLPFFDLFIMPELLAVSLLPPKAVFIDAFIHVLFIIGTLKFGLLPQDAELKALLRTPALIDAMLRPIVVQVLVAVVTYLWVNSATQAIARANRATVIATLERTLNEQASAEIEQKRKLDTSIQQIVDVHTRVANGDFTVRVPLTSDNVLWQIAGALNNLLLRMQRFRQDSYKLQQTNEAVSQFFQARERARGGVISWRPTGTAIDAIVQQYNATAQKPSIQREHVVATPRLQKDQTNPNRGATVTTE